jgi:predicted oxidoreductase
MAAASAISFDRFFPSASASSCAALSDKWWYGSAEVEVEELEVDELDARCRPPDAELEAEEVADELELAEEVPLHMPA